MTTTITDLDDFKALEPFFRIIERGLDGIADGGHFFDLLAEEVIFDYIITTPGYPRHVEGRKAVAELYRWHRRRWWNPSREPSQGGDVFVVTLTDEVGGTGPISSVSRR